MATFPQIKTRIIAKYQSLATPKEKLEFLFEVQERLRIKHNEKGKDFRDGVITEEQWKNFEGKWFDVSKAVGGKLSEIRESVFVNDYGLLVNTDDVEASNAFGNKKLELLSRIAYKDDIDTVWL
jgi:hypothetical protein